MRSGRAGCFQGYRRLPVANRFPPKRSAKASASSGLAKKNTKRQRRCNQAEHERRWNQHFDRQLSRRHRKRCLHVERGTVAFGHAGINSLTSTSALGINTIVIQFDLNRYIARSIGPATAAPMVSGLAPGRVAVIWIVGKSTAGSAATTSSR
jgi:hypothetical protein